MMNPVKIGFLAPYSSIYPGLVPGLISGFYSAIPERYHRLFHVVPEYVGQGGETVTTEAAKKLLHFDGVDILSGVVSYQTLPCLIPTIESRQKLGVFFDMGEYLPHTQQLSESVFCNSFQLWQSEFALGYWAHRQFGEKGAVIMPLYDGGYHLQSAFRQGAVMAGAEELDIHILEYKPDASQVTGQIQMLFSALGKQNPSFIHGLFCGDEARAFYGEFNQSGLSGSIPLTVTAHMASEEVLNPLNNLDLDFYAASLWNYYATDSANETFKKRVAHFAGLKPDLFTLLGYEVGLLFSQLIGAFQKRDWQEIKTRLKTETIDGPRGRRSFCLRSDHALPVIDVEKIGFHEGRVQKLVVEQGKAMGFNHDIYEMIHRETVSGWQNPYLCV